MPRILEIIRQAQRRMAAAGSLQWQDGYPAPANIASDLAHGYGHVICRSGQDTPKRGQDEAAKLVPANATAGKDSPDERYPDANGNPDPAVETILAYGAIVFDGEPAYEALDGTWLSDSPYVVVHRLAVADEALGLGLGTEFLNRTEQLARRRGIVRSGSIPISTTSACCTSSPKMDLPVAARLSTAAENAKPSRNGSIPENKPHPTQPVPELPGPKNGIRPAFSKPDADMCFKKTYLRVTMSLKKSSSETS